MEDWRIAIDPKRLSRWIEIRGMGSGEFKKAVLLGGGTQNILLKFDPSGRIFVLRRPPPHFRKNSNDTMRHEMRMLETLSDTTAPHPKLILGCPEENVLVIAFDLTEPVEGFAPITGLPALHAGSPDIR